MVIPYLIRLFILASFAVLGSGNSNCPVRRCRHHGPEIRFPFWLDDDHNPEHCAGYPGFGLSCTKNDDTMLEIPFPVKGSLPNQTNLPFLAKFVIKEINYKMQILLVSEVDGCRPASHLKLDLFESPFQSDILYDYAFFNCSSKKSNDDLKPIPCLSNPGYQVYAVNSNTHVFSVPLISCSKMYQVSSVPFALLHWQFPHLLSWSEPTCRHCEAKGKSCRFKDNPRTQDVECFDNGLYTGPLEKVKLAGLILGPILLVLIAMGTHQTYRSKKIKKEDQLKIEQFLEDYIALKPTRYSYADIKRITGNFSEKLGQGGYGTVYKGKLSNEISVAVKVLNNTKRDDGEDFINEVGTIGQIHHVNIVRLVGYCADGFRRVLVYEFLPNHSLEKFTSLKNEGKLLGLEKLQDIALGIAKGIEYLHQGCEQRILHFDIKPHNILLDHNFNPKISDFGEAKLCSKEQSVVSMTAARGTMGYIAPEVFSRNFGKVSCKSDVYSFGMVLLEMVGCRKNIIIDGAQDTKTGEAYFPEWIYKKLDQGEDITIQIENKDDNMIARKLMIVGLWCIQWYPVDRPSMKVLIQMLEAEGTPAMPQNPFGSKITIGVGKKRATVSCGGSELTSICELEE